MCSPCRLYLCTFTGPVCVCAFFSHSVKISGTCEKQNGDPAMGWLTSRCRHLTTGTCYCSVRDKARTLSAQVSFPKAHRQKCVLCLKSHNIWLEGQNLSQNTGGANYSESVVAIIWPWCHTDSLLYTVCYYLWIYVVMYWFLFAEKIGIQSGYLWCQKSCS